MLKKTKINIFFLMEIVEWCSGVNRIIQAESTVTIGQNAVTADKSENGNEMTRLNATFTPDIWNVSMTFSHSTNSSFYNTHTINGKNVTEWEAFQNWYKYKTKNGTKPFYFANISDPSGKTFALYKIRSDGMPSGTPNGVYIKCQMKWQEVKNEAITVQDPTINGDYIDCTNGAIDFRFNESVGYLPDKSKFTVKYRTGNESSTSQDLVIKSLDFDGNKSCILYFDEFNDYDIYYITASYSDDKITTSSVSGRLLVAQGSLT